MIVAERAGRLKTDTAVGHVASVYRPGRDVGSAIIPVDRKSERLFSAHCRVSKARIAEGKLDCRESSFLVNIIYKNWRRIRQRRGHVLDRDCQGVAYRRPVIVLHG